MNAEEIPSVLYDGAGRAFRVTPVEPECGVVKLGPIPVTPRPPGAKSPGEPPLEKFLRENYGVEPERKEGG